LTLPATPKDKPWRGYCRQPLGQKAVGRPLGRGSILSWRSHITVCTNATLVRPRDAKLAVGFALDAHVSIDGESAHHDCFRGFDGAFRRAVQGVQRLVKAGVALTIVTTVAQANLGQFLRTAQWALNAGAKRLPTARSAS
jgi:MoaA/NifB/PqqE/SkfB family radical SAM enzyme